MKKYLTILCTVFCINFLHALKPSFSVSSGWSYIKIENMSDNFINVGIGTIVPYSKYIGLRAGILGLTFGGGGTVVGVSSRIGIIEMIPTKYVSPYFTQSIHIDHISAGSNRYTYLGLGLGFGLEFLSSYYVSPYIGGGFAFTNNSINGSSISGIGFSAGIGIRFSWTK